MSRGASVRLFAAVDPPPEVAAELRRWARAAARPSGAEREAPALRVLEASSLHVTLLFLGERPAGEVDALAAALAEAAQRAQPCELETGPPLWLPPRRPRALAVEVHDPSGELASLQRELAGALCEITGEQPPRRFRAHVTVARTRAAPRPHAALPPTPQLRFAVAEAVLYRSRLDPGGARYEPLAEAALGGWPG
jgi:2'-5' RNA ligase